MRPIDADKLMERLRKRFYMHDLKSDFDRCARSVILSCMEAVQRAATICEPPNDPLALEELREMDGEPVWVINNEQKAVYALTYSPCSIVYLTLADGTRWDAEDLLDEGCKIYRRKPEKGMK